MPKISEEHRAERLEQILEGARRCFAEHGYEGATVAQLEQEIGLSRGAIFNYFPSKEDLFVELAVRDSARMSEIWREQGLEAIVREVMELDPAWLSVYLELFDGYATTTTSASGSNLGRRRSRRRTGRVSRRRRAAGSSATTSARARSGSSSTSS